jgi:polyphosphate kinase
LIDPEIIEALYEASRAGVKIELSVRGICCLRPGVHGLSENISVSSVLDRYLEHARIFWFRRGGRGEVFIASADWMPRNLDRRVELMVSIADEAGAERLKRILRTSLDDTAQAWRLLPDGRYVRRRSEDGKKLRSQWEFQREAERAARRARESRRVVFEPYRPPNRRERRGALNSQRSPEN